MEVMEAQFAKYFNQVNNAFYVGLPDNYKKLSIFPIFTDLETLSTVPYTKLENEVKITEVSDDGSVPQLLANNTSEFNVVIYEGEILEGLKQTRVLNTTVLLAPNTKTYISVSCVEQGSWSGRTQYARSAHRFYDPGLRLSKQMSVRKKLEAGRGYFADQRTVWRDIDRELTHRKRRSGTKSYLAAYEDVEGYSFSKGVDIDEEKQHHKYEKNEGLKVHAVKPQQVGYVLSMGDNIINFEIFDSNKTLLLLWDKLYRSFISFAERQHFLTRETTTSLVDVEKIFFEYKNSQARQFKTSGIGQMNEFESQSSIASVLTLNNNLIHSTGFIKNKETWT